VHPKVNDYYNVMTESPSARLDDFFKLAITAIELTRFSALG
jgi:hypothetical protein